MIRQRSILLFALIMLSILALSGQDVVALPFDSEYTDQSIGAGEWFYAWNSYLEDDVISGYFETHSDTQGLKFFICDSTNWAIWDGGGVADVYNLETNMHTLGFSFTVPYADTWYCVYSNDEGSQGVTVDIGIDINGDNTPSYSTPPYEVTVYAHVLGNDEYYYTSAIYNTGTVVTGHLSTFFPTDGVDFFICDETNFALWDSGETADVYSYENDMHQATIDTFTIPTSGRWYFVFSAIGQSDTVTLSFGIDIDASNAIPDSPDFMVMGGVAVGIVALIAIIFIVCRKRAGAPPSTPAGIRPTTPPDTGPARVGDKQQIVLGALKSYPRVGVSELAELLDMTEDDVRSITLKLIASGSVSGTFDRHTDEFTSVAAAETGRELKRDSADSLEIPRCPNCFAPLNRTLVPGETVQCPNCGTTITG